MLIVRKIFTENRRVLTRPPLSNAQVSHEQHDFISNVIINATHSVYRDCLGTRGNQLCKSQHRDALRCFTLSHIKEHSDVPSAEALSLGSAALSQGREGLHLWDAGLSLTCCHAGPSWEHGQRLLVQHWGHGGVLPLELDTSSSGCPAQTKGSMKAARLLQS